MTRTLLDFPSITRSTVGFDRLFDDIERTFVNSSSNNYPPYNVEQLNENEWRISLAVAGFGMDNLEITLEKNLLTVEGTAPKSGEESVKYLHKGISGRNFRRTFMLADHVEVENASLELGILTLSLKRNVPEALQPKRIAINRMKTIEG